MLVVVGAGMRQWTRAMRRRKKTPSLRWLPNGRSQRNGMSLGRRWQRSRYENNIKMPTTDVPSDKLKEPYGIPKVTVEYFCVFVRSPSLSLLRSHWHKLCSECVRRHFARSTRLCVFACYDTTDNSAPLVSQIHTQTHRRPKKRSKKIGSKKIAGM